VGVDASTANEQARLRGPATRWLWIAAALATVGIWMQECAAPWLMTELTSDARLVVAVQAAAGVALSIVVIVVGVIADMVDRRRLLIGTQLAAAVTAVGLGVLTLIGLVRPWLLVGLASVAGAGHGALVVGFTGMLPAGVASTRGGKIWAMNAGQLSSRRSSGAVVGGVVVATAGAAAAFFVNAAAFLAVALSLRRVPVSRTSMPVTAAHAGRSLRTGLATAALTPTIVGTLVRCAAYSFAAAAVWALLVVYCREELGLGALGFGLLTSASGAGGLAGIFVLARWSSGAAAGALTSILGVVCALTPAAMVMFPSVPVAACSLTIAGAAWFAIVFALGLVAQAAVPEELRGRTFALYLAVLYLSAAVGSVVWGHVAATARFGTRERIGSDDWRRRRCSISTTSRDQQIACFQETRPPRNPGRASSL
jgi:MFS family permease